MVSIPYLYLGTIWKDDRIGFNFAYDFTVALIDSKVPEWPDPINVSLPPLAHFARRYQRGTRGGEHGAASAMLFDVW